MFPPSFTPITYEGMSIITALCIFGMITAACIYFGWDSREHKRLSHQIEDVDEKASILFQKSDQINCDLSDIKTHISEIHEAINWIKKYMEHKQ